MAFAPAIPLVLMAVSTAVQVASAMQQAKAAEKAGEFNAAMYQRNADITRQNAAINETRQRREATLRMGANVASVGSSGIQLNGSALDVLESNAAQEEMDALMIRWNGENSASNLEAQGSLALAEGKNQASALRMGAVSTLFGNAAKMWGMGAGGSAAGGATSYSGSNGFASPLQRA